MFFVSLKTETLPRHMIISFHETGVETTVQYTYMAGERRKGETSFMEETILVSD